MLFHATLESGDKSPHSIAACAAGKTGKLICSRVRSPSKCPRGRGRSRAALIVGREHPDRDIGTAKQGSDRRERQSDSTKLGRTDCHSASLHCCPSASLCCFATVRPYCGSSSRNISPAGTLALQKPAGTRAVHWLAGTLALQKPRGRGRSRMA